MEHISGPLLNQITEDLNRPIDLPPSTEPMQQPEDDPDLLIDRPTAVVKDPDVNVMEYPGDDQTLGE